MQYFKVILNYNIYYNINIIIISLYPMFNLKLLWSKIINFTIMFWN